MIGAVAIGVTDPDALSAKSYLGQNLLECDLLVISVESLHTR